MRRALYASDLFGLITLSTLLFLTYPTLLWNTAPGASHVGRFVVSYLAVVPLTLIFFWFRHRAMTLSEITVAVLIVWSIKMLITVGLYHFMVAGTAPHLQPNLNEPSAATTHYEAAANFEGALLKGRVVDTDGEAIAHALVMLPEQLVGKPFDRRARASAGATAAPDVEITSDDIRPVLGVIAVGERIVFRNSGSTTATVRGTIDGRSAFNVAALPGVPVATAKQQHAGLVHLEPSAGGIGARAWIYVADNPYFTWTDAAGEFALAQVPDGSLELLAYAVIDEVLVRARAAVAGRDHVTVVLGSTASEEP